MNDQQTPIYRVRDYDKDETEQLKDQRNVRSNARKRRTKRKRNAPDYSVSDMIWVIIAATLFTVILIVSGVVLVTQFMG